MKGWQVAAVAALAAVMSGCAGTGKFPEHQSLNVAVSSGAGTLDDADHEIPGSQVTVGGRDGATSVGSAFGALGLAIGASIDVARNEADLKGAGPALAQKFDGIVTSELVKRARGKPDYRITQRADEDTAMLLFPSARFVSGGEARPRLTLRIEARFGERTKTSFSQRRDYVYVPAETRAFLDGGEGWADAGGAAFKATTARGFERLVEAFSSDVRGAFDAVRAAPDAAAKVRWRSPYMKSAATSVLLAEHPDFLVLAPAGYIYGLVFVIDRKLLES